MNPRKKFKPLRIILNVILTIVLLITGFFIVRSLTKPVVDFADPQLALAIRENLEIWEGPIYQRDVLDIYELDAYGKGIRRLEGIENLRELRRLNLHDNYVEDLTPLANLESLNSLNLRNNEIYNLDQINFDQIIHLPLVELSLRHNVFDLEDGNRIRLVDISLLGFLTQLEVLELRDNHIADISPLASLVRLRRLDIRENRIENVEHLRGLTSLEYLNLRENQINDLAPLANMPGLVYINIHTNPIDEGWETLANFTELKTLIMQNVQIADYAEVLSGLLKLTRVNMRNTGIHKVSFLTNMTGLEILDLRENTIEDLSPLAHMYRLEEADFRENKIVEISPLSNLKQLRSLNLRDNEIVDLRPLSGLSELLYLNIHSNPVEVGIQAIGNLQQLETLIMRNVVIGDEHRFLLNLTNLQGLNIQNTGITSLKALGILMDAGALQDDFDHAILAYVNILDNSLIDRGIDLYAPVRPYWLNISYRYPLELP